MPNRLAAATSPYLRQHADNPVDWFPWGDEAFAKARAEQKPVFLSIGYSTCHWCHVMAHESFESPEVAAALNRDFVPVKLDREERPDLDRVYMSFVQHTTGHGGWPLSLWLTPDLKPFYGGTYFPPEDRHGRPGFLTLLGAIARHWREDRAKVDQSAEEVTAALRRYAIEGGPREDKPPGAPRPLHEHAGEAFEAGYKYFYEAHDPTWGGFGGAPKFPRASALNFLFRAAVIQGSESEAGREAVGIAVRTLEKMAMGGLHDHLGGGFHRYSVDEQWHVPHFEKMLYDQALIALNYLEAQQATGIGNFGWVVRGIFDYVRRDLTGPHGAFHSAEDADSLLRHGGKEHAEGAFYVWTKDEIDNALGGATPSSRGSQRGEGTPPPSDAALFNAHFDVKPDGNVAHDPHGEFTGKNVLMQRQSLARTAVALKLDLPVAEEKLLAAIEKLRALRAARPRPSLDDKVITAWNGLMISALARGSRILGEPEHLAAATRAAEFLRANLWDEKTATLRRCWRDGRSDIAGFAEDYTFLIQGLLDLYEAGFDQRWLRWATQLQECLDAGFWDAERGGYFNSRADDATVIVRMKDDYDGAEPSPNSVAVSNLVRLDWMLGDGGATPPSRAEGSAPPQSGFREKALRTVAALRHQWERLPQALPQMLCSLSLVLDPPRTVVLAGDARAADFRALHAVLHEKFGPVRAVLHADGGDVQRWLAERKPYLRDLRPLGGKATAYVCEDYACQRPVMSPDDLRSLLA